MTSYAKKYTSHSQLWIIAGPLLMSCILIIATLHSSSIQWTLLFTAFCGIVACYQWRRLGAYSALSVISLLFAYHIYVTPHIWLWVTILSLSIMATIITTYLCIEESYQHRNHLQAHLEELEKTNLAFLSRLQNAQEDFKTERQHAQVQVAELERKIAELKSSNESTESFLLLVRDEIALVHERNEGLLKELSEAQQKVMPETMPTPTIVSLDPNQDAIIQKLNDEIAAKNELHYRLENENQQLRIMRDDATALETTLRSHIEKYRAEISALHRLNSEEKNLTLHHISEGARLQTAMLELNGHIEELAQEKQALESTITLINEKVEQFENNAKNDTSLIETYQNTVQTLKVALEKSEANLQQQLTFSAENKSKVDHQLLQQKQQLEEMTKKWSLASQQLIEWQSKVNEYSGLASKLSIAHAQLHASEEELKLSKEYSIKLQNEIEFSQQKHAQLLSEEKSSRLLLESERNVLQSHNKVIEEQLTLLKEELLQLKTQQNTKEIVEDTQKVRKLEGLYKQLREQFAEKTATLDSTRKELFYVQEKLEATLRSEMETVFEGDKTQIESIANILLSADDEMESMRKDYLAEIDSLQSLVTQLSKA